MTNHLRILHFEDSAADAELIAHTMGSLDLPCEITVIKTEASFRAALNSENPDLILSDYSIPGFDGLSALDLAHKEKPEIPFIFISGTIGEERAVEAMKHGATDYVPKDRLARLVPAVRRALNEATASKMRQQAEERIHEQAAVLDQAQDAICLNDLGQNITYWNRGAEQLYGWRANEAVGRNALELLFPADSISAAEALKNLIRKGSWRGELQQVTKEGKIITVDSRWTLMRDQNGEPKSVLLISTDITEKKQIEAQLQRTQRMESIGALAGGIAHDLNNSLAPILMAVDMVRRDSLQQSDQHLLDIIKSSSRRSADLVKQILSFARGTGGRQSQLAVSPLIRDVVKLARDTFPHSIKIQSRIANGLYSMEGNSTQIHQVLLNLCINARDAMPDGGSLEIEAANFHLKDEEAVKWQRPPGRYLVITVADSGQGIPDNIRGRIFEPFFTTKTATHGTGLGLSIVMGIVKTHGGFIEVLSRAQKGTKFEVYLPANTKIEIAADQPLPAQIPNGAGQRILLVDDEVAILEVTKILLEFLNFRVVTATNGAQAVSMYEQSGSGIDLVMMDLMMPGMNGVEAMKKIREINPAAKIVGMSGLGPETPLVASAKSIAQVVLRKPFATQELLSALQHFQSDDGLRERMERRHVIPAPEVPASTPDFSPSLQPVGDSRDGAAVEHCVT